MHPIKATYRLLTTNFHKKSLVYDLVARDFRLKYLGSLLGRYWNFIHPLAMIAIYTFVFSKVMKSRLSADQESSPFAFTIYLCAGLLPWNLFVETIQRCCRSFLDHAHLIKKVSFPKEILPLVIGGSASLTFFLNLMVYALVIIASQEGVSFKALAFFPLIYLCQMLFALGLGMILSVLNVFFRDTEQVVQIGLQVWFWLTPIVYLESFIPPSFQFILKLNPMAYFISSYHRIFFEKSLPQPSLLIGCFSFGVIFFIIGCFTLLSFKDELVDEL